MEIVFIGANQCDLIARARSPTLFKQLIDEAKEIYHFLIKLASTHEVYFSTNLLTKVLFEETAPVEALVFMGNFTISIDGSLGLAATFQPERNAFQCFLCAQHIYGNEPKINLCYFKTWSSSSYCPEERTINSEINLLRLQLNPKPMYAAPITRLLLPSWNLEASNHNQQCHWLYGNIKMWTVVLIIKA